MLNPDRRKPFAGMPPQDLRHDLSELRKGMIRIDPEPFAMSLRRFGYNQARGVDVSRGPGVKGEIVIFETIRIPLPRRERFAGCQVDTVELADIAAAEADELLSREYAEGMPDEIAEAVKWDERAAQELRAHR